MLIMDNFKEFLKLMITAHSGISSKRVCGVIGFFTVIFILIYCTVCSVQAPMLMEPFIYAVCMLLGIDSIMSPFYKNNKKDGGAE